MYRNEDVMCCDISQKKLFKLGRLSLVLVAEKSYGSS